MGKVFSIEEFSVFDGDGIRTTVFLKGCPLRCSWCHSPEGQSCTREYLRSPNGCLQCEKCLNATFLHTGKRELSEYSISACPRNLVRICGEEYTSEKLVKKLEKNLDILNGSGGGVTFSGGEPLMQAEFLFECLTLLQGKTNRGLQTTGFCEQSTFEKILTQTDLVLYDLKLFQENEHIRYTGVGNQNILKNYQILAKSGVKFITRIPLIPTVTDTEENIRLLCQFMQEQGVRYAELMPYNTMAGAKYKLAGKTYKPNFDESVPVQTRKEIFEQFGIQMKIL